MLRPLLKAQSSTLRNRKKRINRKLVAFVSAEKKILNNNHHYDNNHFGRRIVTTQQQRRQQQHDGSERTRKIRKDYVDMNVRNRSKCAEKNRNNMTCIGINNMNSLYQQFDDDRCNQKSDDDHDDDDINDLMRRYSFGNLLHNSNYFSNRINEDAYYNVGTGSILRRGYHTLSTGSNSCSRGYHINKAITKGQSRIIAAASVQKRCKTFVSKHTTLDIKASQILEFCKKYGISTQSARTTTTHVILRECPFCSKPTNNKMDNMYKCYISIGPGAHYCHRCGKGGSWYDFKNTFNPGNGNISSLSSHFKQPAHKHQQQQSMAASTLNSSVSKYDHRQDQESKQQKSKFQTSKSDTGIKCLPMPQPRLQAVYSSSLMDMNRNAGSNDQHDKNQNDGNNETSNPALTYLLNVRGLSKTTLRKYGVGCAKYSFPNEKGQYEESECVTFPWLMTIKQIQEQEDLRGAVFNPSSTAQILKEQLSSSKKGQKVNADEDILKNEKYTATKELIDHYNDITYLTRRIKIRALKNKGWQRLDPSGGGWGLFGFHTIPKDATELIITEGEYDAMAVFQATKRPTVSLPNGCRNLPIEILPMLERFDKIYLWMDYDQPGIESAEKFVKKVGMNRCYIITPENCDSSMFQNNNGKPPKDANEALLQGVDIEQMITNSTQVRHSKILSFDDLRTSVLHEIMNPDEYSGIPIESLPRFTSIVKGFRKGEMTILSGQTGSGKTTFLTQVSLDLCEQNQNVLWGSFEIKNTRLIAKMLQQFAREPLLNNKNHADDSGWLTKLEAIADRFSSLPLHFMKFHGGSDIDDVLDAMDYAVYVNDVQHIVLDNMQFMISRNSKGGSFDKFEVQDMAIEKFRKFATQRNVHIILVCHPRKENYEEKKLEISSIYGSAKVTQEADTVLLLQAERNRKYIEVKKNRFDGTLGFAPLFFNMKSCRYSETQI